MTTFTRIGELRCYSRHGARVDIIGYIVDDVPPYPCHIALDLGPARASLQLSADDVRALAALCLKIADEADLAHGRYTTTAPPDDSPGAMADTVSHAGAQLGRSAS